MRNKNITQLKKCVTIGFVVACLFSSQHVAGQRFNDSQHDAQQCIDHSATYDRLLFSSVAGVPRGYVSDQTLYTRIVSSRDVLIDIREDRFDQEPINTRVNGALQMPLGHVKTKYYLKSESIVVLGDGLDSFRLETEIKALKQKGFKSIKILDNGILSLLKDSRFLGTPQSHFELRKANPDRLVGAAIAQQESGKFLFINLGKSHSIFNELGLSSIHIPYNNYQIFYESLKQKVSGYIQNNRDLRLVIVHDDPSVYEQIFLAKATATWSKLWFMKEGNQGLEDLRNNIAMTAIAKQKVRYSCQG